MRTALLLTIFSVCLMFSSCTHRTRGSHPLTAMDSIRRIAAIAQQARLRELGKIRENLIGPADMGHGTGEVTKGAQFTTNILSDSIGAVTRSYEKLDAKYKMALQDSNTAYGPLLNRFKVLDSQHKYLSATYTSEGHLLTFHSEVTMDSRHELDYDLRFNEGLLVYIRERRSLVLDTDDLSTQLTDESYFMSGAVVQYSYRDAGLLQPRHGRTEAIRMTRYTLVGDVSGHVAHMYDLFLKDYDILLAQPLEAMIYTSGTSAPTDPGDKGPDKGVPSRGRAFSF